MANPLVSIIILTYKNGLKDVKKCLISLSAVSYKPFEIILVDNASTDNTVIYIEKHFPNVKVIQNRWNMGFCTGNNQGLEIAKGKYILFFNNDAIATPDFLSILVEEFVKDNKLGAIQPKIRQLRDKSLLDACASYLTNTGFLYHYGYSQNQANQKYNKKLYMYSVKGACFLARKSLIDRIGLFDDDYFAYFEETDFCHRVWLSGFKIGYLPSSEIYHLGGAGKEASPFIQFHSYKNRIHTYLKNFELWPLVKILSIHIAMCFGVALMYFVTGKILYSLAIIKAIAWNIVNFKKLIIKRRFVQRKIRKVKDAAILPQILKGVKVSYYKHFLSNARGYYDFDEII